MLTPIIVVFLFKAPMKRTIQNPIKAMVTTINPAKEASELKPSLEAVIAVLAMVAMKSKTEMNIQPVRRSRQQQQFVNLHMFAL